MSKQGWVGVDFDGTLAEYTSWVSGSHVGHPVKPMIERVQRWLQAGREVRIFTARIHPLDRCVWPDDKRELHGTFIENSREDTCWESIEAIRKFCKQHVGFYLPITNVKDFGMIELWDDRAVQVRPNTGEQVGESTRGLS